MFLVPCTVTILWYHYIYPNLEWSPKVILSALRKKPEFVDVDNIKYRLRVGIGR
jgi:hypothetical protein